MFARGISSKELYTQKRSSFLLKLGAVSLLRVSAISQTADPPDISATLRTAHDSYLLVERVTRGCEAERAGIRPGDLILGWTTDTASGELESPFDLQIVELEQAPRGVVKIEGRRLNQKKEWRLKTIVWGIHTRPNMSATFAQMLQDVEQLARAGKLLAAIERWQSAKRVSKEAMPVWLGPWVLVRAISSVPGIPKWEELDAAYQEAIAEAQGATPGVRAELFDWWADSFQNRDDLVNAEKYYKEELSEKLKLGERTLSSSVTLVDLAVVAIKRGDFLRAEDYLQHALATQQEIAPTSALVATSLGNLGVLAHDQGDLASSEDFYREAIAIDEKFPTRTDSLALNLADLGELARRRGDLRAALHYERKALIIAERLHSKTDLVATILSFLGNVALDQGDIARADAYQRRALAIRKRKSPGTLSVALCLIGLGDNAQARGDLLNAEEYYQGALVIEERLASPTIELASFLNDLGEVAAKRGQLARAVAYYRRSISVSEKMSPAGWDQFEAQAALARVLHLMGQAESSIQLYQQALSLLESQAARLGGSDDVRAGFRGRFTGYYRDYVELLAEQGQIPVAFETLEASRARTLLEILMWSRVDLRNGADPELLTREQELLKSLRGKSRYRLQLLAKSQKDQLLSALDQEIDELLRNYHQVEADIRDKSPSYAALTQPRPRTVGELEQLLEPDTILLEYSLGEDRSHVWLLTDTSVTAYPLPRRAVIERLARRAYRCFTVRKGIPLGEGETKAVPGKAAERNCSKATRELSQVILGPVSGFLQDKRLLIVSDGALQYIPFAALPKPQPAQIGVGVARPSELRKPLVVDNEIVNLPSASVLAEIRLEKMNRKPPLKAVAVLADPVFDARDQRVQEKRLRRRLESSGGSVPMSSRAMAALTDDRLFRSASDVGLNANGSLHFNRLMYTRLEAQAILHVTPAGLGMNALDFEASRTTAMSPSLAQYRIVHFATHGLADSRRPELSGLVFSLVNRTGKPQDGFLGLEDIYNLKLPVDLAVLSGCQTALGGEINGEGLISLTRGFMHAGASRVVASLWSVDDLATSELMAKFYHAVEIDKMRPAAALRKAQIEMWKQKLWHSPYYWAAFQIQGDWK